MEHYKESNIVIKILDTYLKNALTYKVISSKEMWVLEEYDPWIDEPFTEKELKAIEDALKGPYEDF